MVKGSSSGSSLVYLEENLGEILNSLPAWQGGERNHRNLDTNDMFSRFLSNTHSIGNNLDDMLMAEENDHYLLLGTKDKFYNMNSILHV